MLINEVLMSLLAPESVFGGTLTVNRHSSQLALSPLHLTLRWDQIVDLAHRCQFHKSETGDPELLSGVVGGTSAIHVTTAEFDAI